MKFTDKIKAENAKRHGVLFPDYDPITANNSPVKRFNLMLDRDNYIRMPLTSKDEILISEIAKYNSLIGYYRANPTKLKGLTVSDLMVAITEIRLKHDFEFWCATCVKVMDKKSSLEVPFILRPAQRKLLAELEDMRLNGVPIRIILLKARQWGGSTLIQIYMAWIQLWHKTNWNSVIIAHLEDAARNIRSMYTRVSKTHPKDIMNITFKPFEGSQKTRVIEERGCIIGIGSSEKPEAQRSFDIKMTHLSEVAFFKSTELKSAEDLAQSVRATVPMQPYTIAVLESTAKGVGNFFHNEWVAAAEGESGYRPVFVAWWEIELYLKEIANFRDFCQNMTAHDEYLWSLGATLEGINWYKTFKQTERYDDWRMCSEFPSTSTEAFQSTGRRAFNPDYVLRARKNVIDPIFVGDIFGDAQKGDDAFKNLKLTEVPGGELMLWAMPDTMNVSNRYLGFADIGGRNPKADKSVLKVFDRYWLTDGGVPEVVAVWRGNCFTPDTMIYTSTGFKPINEVKVGDSVWTHKNRFRKVVRTYKKDYDGELIYIKSQGNYETIKCTPEHPFYSNDVTKQINRKSKIYGGVQRYSYPYMEKIGNEKWVEAKHLRYVAYSKSKDLSNDTTFIIDKYMGGKSKNGERKIIDLKSLFSILGYYLAEGHIKKRMEDGKPSGVIFYFGFSERNTYVVDCYNQLVNLGFKPTIKEKKDVGVCLLKIHDTNFASFLLELCGESSWGKMINPKILEYSKELLSTLLESYWRGDGTTYATDNTLTNSISTVSPILARQIRDILILLGYRPGVYRVISKTKNKDIEKTRPRYNVTWTVTEKTKYTLLDDENFIAYKVKSKTTEQYSGYVYNLEVQEDNSYSTESYIVHNCDQDLFAWKCAQIMWLFNKGLLAVEVNSLLKKGLNSEGSHHLTVLDEISSFYPNLYARTNPERIREGIPSIYGFHTNRATKPMIIDMLNSSLRDDGYKERHKRSCDEMDSYEIKNDGNYGAVDGAKDDCVIVTAGGLWISANSMDAPKVITFMPARNKKRIISEASF